MLDYFFVDCIWFYFFGGDVSGDCLYGVDQFDLFVVVDVYGQGQYIVVVGELFGVLQFFDYVFLQMGFVFCLFYLYILFVELIMVVVQYVVVVFYEEVYFFWRLGLVFG